MQIKKFILGSLQANCYLLINNKECLLIDPGDDGSLLLEEIQKQNLNLVGIIATHGHFDHIGAVGEIQLSYKVPLFISDKDKFLIDRVEETATYFLGNKHNIIKPITVKYLTNSIFTIADFRLQVLKTPGHTPGSLSYYFKEENVIFTGDTLFKDAIGQYDFTYSSKLDLKKSLDKILKLPLKTKILSGHGEETSIALSRDFLSLSSFFSKT